MGGKSVVLVSGGMDSTTLVYWLLKKGVAICPLLINYGQHCWITELETARQLHERKVGPLHILDISGIYAGSKSRLINEADLWKDQVTADDLYLPYRNLLILSVAVAFAQSHECNSVYSAFINSNHAKEIDCSREFFTVLESMFADVGSVRIEMPFRYMTKTEVAKIGIGLGVPIAETFSCQVNSRIHCGVCPNCEDRQKALQEIFQ